MIPTLETTCCIVGGGPAGMMLGVLLARAGVETVVLEKHGDFLRDFRGDTIHPSTLELMHELGVLDEFLLLPHQKAYHLSRASLAMACSQPSSVFCCQKTLCRSWQLAQASSINWSPSNLDSCIG